MTTRKNRKKPHEFAKLPEFDKAMRKLADVPPEKIRTREQEQRTPRTTK